MQGLRDVPSVYKSGLNCQIPGPQPLPLCLGLTELLAFAQTACVLSHFQDLAQDAAPTWNAVTTSSHPWALVGPHSSDLPLTSGVISRSFSSLLVTPSPNLHQVNTSVYTVVAINILTVSCLPALHLLPNSFLSARRY